MSNVERLTITLPADMVRRIRAKVEEGRHASDSEVIREAMRAWQEREDARVQRVAAVRAKIAEADADPRPSLTDEDVDRHFEAKMMRSVGSPGRHA